MMTIDQQNLIIDAIISDNPDATIKDYLEFLAEIRPAEQVVEPPLVVPIIKPGRKPSRAIRKYYQTYHLRL